MRAPHLTPPIQLSLPGGIVADYVPESDPPAYRVSGELLAVDVMIPADLAAWYWHGSFLVCGMVSISTATFPPPGYPCDRQTCFDAAREIERVRAEHEARRLATPLKKAKRTKTKPAPVQLAQAAMEL